MSFPSFSVTNARQNHFPLEKQPCRAPDCGSTVPAILVPRRGSTMTTGSPEGGSRETSGQGSAALRGYYERPPDHNRPGMMTMRRLVAFALLVTSCTDVGHGGKPTHCAKHGCQAVPTRQVSQQLSPEMFTVIALESRTEGWEKDRALKWEWYCEAHARQVWVRAHTPLQQVFRFVYPTFEGQPGSWYEDDQGNVVEMGR